jgi:hypothetical protein
MARAFHYRDRNIYLRLYVQYVRPHLEFASSAWSPWAEVDKEVLEKIQRRAISMVSGLKGKDYNQKLLELGLTTLEERRHQVDMIPTFKIVRGFDKVDRDTWFRSKWFLSRQEPPEVRIVRSVCGHSPSGAIGSSSSRTRKFWRCCGSGSVRSRTFWPGRSVSGIPNYFYPRPDATGHISLKKLK